MDETIAGDDACRGDRKELALRLFNKLNVFDPYLFVLDVIEIFLFGREGINDDAVIILYILEYVVDDVVMQQCLQLVHVAVSDSGQVIVLDIVQNEHAVLQILHQNRPQIPHFFVGDLF